jgi:hypothetical protein
MWGLSTMVASVLSAADSDAVRRKKKRDENKKISFMQFISI